MTLTTNFWKNVSKTILQNATYLLDVLCHVGEDTLLATCPAGGPRGAYEEPGEGGGVRGETLHLTEHLGCLLPINRDASPFKVSRHCTHIRLILKPFRKKMISQNKC